MTYPGGKGGAGVYQMIINQIPPHRVYIEPFLGGGIQAVAYFSRWQGDPKGGGENYKPRPGGECFSVGNAGAGCQAHHERVGQVTMAIR
jgi:hypothetical protein